MYLRHIVSRLAVFVAVSAVVGVGLASSAQAATPNPILVAQQQLQRLGFPDGGVDGQNGPMTEQGLCAFRAAYNLPGGRTAPLNSTDLRDLQVAKAGPFYAVNVPNVAIRTVGVDQTCQVLFLAQNGMVTAVIPVSTGRPGYPTPNGNFSLGWQAKGWTLSTEFADGWMFDFWDFSGGKGIHGVYPWELPTYNDSHGCVRMSEANIVKLWGILKAGDAVVIYGHYQA